MRESRREENEYEQALQRRLRRNATNNAPRTNTAFDPCEARHPHEPARGDPIARGTSAGRTSVGLPRRGSSGSRSGTQSFIARQLGAAGSNVPATEGGGSSVPLHAFAGSQVATTSSVRVGGRPKPPSPPGGTLAKRVHTRQLRQLRPSHCESFSQGHGTHHSPACEDSPRAPGGHAGGSPIASA
jgi:hypothetical protein